MERKLTVINNGYLFAEINFVYDSTINGMATITTYAPQILEPIVEGLHPVVPIKLYSLIFTQTTATSIDAIKTFDIDFVAEQFSSDPAFTIAGCSFSYNNNPMQFRYLIQDGDQLLGIANIQELFIENEKSLQWISATKIKADLQLASGSLENNMQLLDRLATNLGMAKPIFKQVIQ